LGLSNGRVIRWRDVGQVFVQGPWFSGPELRGRRVGITCPFWRIWIPGGIMLDQACRRGFKAAGCGARNLSFWFGHAI
jgi:hypothetical protein